MLNGDVDRALEQEMIRQTTEMGALTRLRDYDNDIETALIRINGIKFYNGGTDYRRCHREQFLKGEMEMFIDWEETDSVREREMSHLPPAPVGYCYLYNHKKHQALCVRKKFRKGSTSHNHVRRPLEKERYGKNYCFGKMAEG